ncbi:TPA: hypothetical protein ACX6PT_003224 [Photobacterium damselae]
MINYIRVLGSLQILTLSYGFYVAFLFEFLFFFYKRTVKKKSLTILYGVFTFIFIVFLQYFLLDGYGSSIVATVSDPLLRFSKSSTLGYYVINGNISSKYFFLTIVYMFYIYFLVNNIDDKNEFWDFIKKNIVIYLILSIFIFLVTLDSGFANFLKSLSGFAPNFLTKDEFGYRISVGFFEPSMMSVYISTILAIATKNRNLKYISMFTFLILFLLSRSGSLFILYFSIIFFINYKIKFLPFCILVLGILSVSFIPHEIIVKLSKDVFFLRSLSERLYFPNFELLSYPFFVGVDYGNVTTFFPILSIIVQIGFLGLFVFFIIARFDLSIIIIIFLLNSVSRNISSYEFWMAIFFLISMRNYLQSNDRIKGYDK